MSGNYKNTSGYSASDIQKYWRGELSAREMHEMEKAAQEDPFLADALEGMEPLQTPPAPAAAFDQDLEELQARLEKRITQKKEKRTILLFRPWTRVAAAVLLLAGLSTAAYYTLLNKSGQKESVASAIPAHKDKALPAAPVTADSSAVATLAATANNQPADKENDKKAGKESYKEKEPDSVMLAKKIMRQHAMSMAREEARQQKADTRQATDKDLAERESKKVVAKTEKEKALDNQHYLPAMRIAPRLPSPAPQGNGLTTVRKDTVTYNAGLYPPLGSASRSKQLSDHLAFSGIVLDEHNHPVSGASVYLNGRTDINTLTDRHGVFNLKLRPTDSALKVMVAYVGYAQTSIALNTLDQQNIIGNNIIRLQPQHSSLDEVVVVGYGTQRKETLSSTLTDGDEKIDSLWLKVTPVSGRLLYQDYLTTASKKLLLDSTIKGDEIISFNVNKKGELSSFRIEQSLSPAHDSSTIRLVREGPSWKLLRGRQARAAVKVSF